MQLTRTPTAALKVLGAFRLEIAGDVVQLPVQARRVLSFLALADGLTPRATIAGRLWATCTMQTASARLRTALWRIRREADLAISCRSDFVALGAEVDVDLHRARLYARGLEQRDGEPDAQDIDFMSRDLLPDWDEDWLLMDRERFRQDRLHALERLSAEFTTRGRHADAIAAALAAVASEPLRESGQAALIEAHLAERNVSEALRHYDAYRQMLAIELGIEPTTRLTTLILPYLRGSRKVPG